MNKKIKAYLKKVAGKINNPIQRRSTYLELRSHLLDLVDNKISQGADKKSAITEVLKNLPDPNKFGKKLNNAGQPWFWRYPLITLSLLSFTLLLFIVIIGSHVFTTQYLKPILAENVIPNQKIVTYMVRDLETLSKAELFPNTPRTNNAAFFLNNSLGGIGRNGSKLPELKKAKKLLLKYLGWQRDKKVLNKLLLDKNLFIIDSAWLTQLSAFDHVDFSSLKEIQKIIQPLHHSNSIEKIVAWSTMPILNVSELNTWLKIYILQQHKNEKTLEALKLTRHIARLVHSNGLLSDHIAAALILKTENILSKTLNVAWSPIPWDTIEAYRRVSWAWPGVIYQSYHNGKIPNEFQKYATRELGLCSGVGEHFIGFQSMSDFLYPQALFETSFRKELFAAKSLAEQLLRKCDRFEQFKNFLTETPKGKNTLWNKEMLAVWTIGGLNPIFHFLPNPSRLPYLRRVIVYYLMTLGFPNYTRVYEDLIQKDEAQFNSAFINRSISINNG